jgi:hypothetical protein
MISMMRRGGAQRAVARRKGVGWGEGHKVEVTKTQRYEARDQRETEIRKSKTMTKK